MSKSIIAVVCVVAFAGVASAEEWSETHSFSRGDASAIKVFEPDGYTASVTIDGNAQSDQVPTVLRVPNADNFVVVTFTSPSGAKWSKKIETKKYQVTELRVKHTPPAAQPASGGAKKKFFGKFMNSKNKPCAVEDNIKTKVEFVAGDGTSAASFMLPGSMSLTGEVPEGDYSVRTFRVDPDGTTTYRNTRNASIKADGWVATMFCTTNGGVDISVK